MADAVLITEAGEKSDSLYTANFAIDQGRSVMAVPGNIYSSLSLGTNNLLKSFAAAPVTSYIDVLHILGLEDKSRAVHRVVGRNDNEQRLLDLMQAGNSDGNQILERRV